MSTRYKVSQNFLSALFRRSYNINPTWHIFPDVHELPDDFHWTYSGQGPVPRDRPQLESKEDIGLALGIAASSPDLSGDFLKDLCDYPIPVAYLDKINDTLTLVNGDEPAIAPYHSEILDVLEVTGCQPIQ